MSGPKFTLVALVLAALAPAPARAADDVSAVGLQRGAAVALALYGPVCGSSALPAVDWAVPDGASDTSGENAALAWSDFADCAVALNPQWRGTPFWTDASDVCSVVVHEWGHLAGLPHSDDPASPMSATFHVIDACRDPAPLVKPTPKRKPRRCARRRCRTR